MHRIQTLDVLSSGYSVCLGPDDSMNSNYLKH